MTYTFRIEKTKFLKDGTCDTNAVTEKTGLSLDAALLMLSDYVQSNPGGHIAEASNGIIDYESEDATIDAVIDFDE